MSKETKTIESVVEKIVGGYDWDRITIEAKACKIQELYSFVEQIINDFASLRTTSCNYDDVAGDTWTIDESEFQKIFQKYYKKELSTKC